MPSRSTAPWRRPPRSWRASTWRGRSTRSPRCTTRDRPPSWRWPPGRSCSTRPQRRPTSPGCGAAAAGSTRPANGCGAGAGRGGLRARPPAGAPFGLAENVLAQPGLGPSLSPRPPAGWDQAEAWELQRRAVAEDMVKPALARWVATIKELLPRARPSDQAGLAHLPGGAEDYARAIRIYTTLPLRPEELHQTGLDQIAALEARAVELGAGLGLSGLDEVFAAVRDSAGKIPPQEAIRQAEIAVKRAEARAPEVFPAPLPPPCEVTPMPEVVAASGAAPHYTPPRLDGGRAGTFWFNTERPTAGTGWDIEAV